MSKPRSILDSIRDRAERMTVKQRALDEAPLGITIADVTAEDQPLIYINEGFTELTGYDEEYALGRNCRFLQGEETEQQRVDKMREAIESEQSVQVEVRNYRKDGTMFWNEVTLSPIRYDDTVPYYLGFQQDITLRREYRERLESQRDDLDVLNQIVRHDIRNDLQITLAALEIIEANASERMEPHVQRALESTRQGIELTATARDMANTMLSSGTEFEAVPLRTALTEQVEETRSAHPEATVDIYGTIPAVDIRADEMLESVFRNLLKNAIQHNDSETPVVNVTATNSDNEVIVRIEDNGPGVPPELEDEVFEKGVTARDSRSTGLGLYLVDRLVDNYGGTVQIEDADTGGAAVVVTLQIAS